MGSAGSLVAPDLTQAAPVDGGPSRPYLPYGRNSYFKSRVDDATIHHRRTRAFRAFMASHPDQRGFDHPRINGVRGNMWGTAFAMGDANDPVWRIRRRSNDNPRGRFLHTRGFHAPGWLGEVISGTSDSPVCVVDRVAGVTIFLTKARVAGGRRLDVEHASVTYHRSNGLDYRNPRSNDRRNFSSRGRISDAMVIRRDLVRHGVNNNTDLGHVLHLFLAETNSRDGFRHPMTGAEDGKRGFGAEGERLAIHPRVNLRRRGLSPEALVIARTLQRYGCYIGDNSGSATCLKAEQETRAHPVWRGRLGRDALEGITWDDFVVVR